MRFEPTFRSARMRPADGPSNGSETLSRIQSLADYTIAMLESSFRKRQWRIRTNEKQVLRWQTFAFPQGPLDARAAHFVRHADLTASRRVRVGHGPCRGRTVDFHGFVPFPRSGSAIASSE